MLKTKLVPFIIIFLSTLSYAGFPAFKNSDASKSDVRNILNAQKTKREHGEILYYLKGSIFDTESFQKYYEQYQNKFQGKKDPYFERSLKKHFIKVMSQEMAVKQYYENTLRAWLETRQNRTCKDENVTKIVRGVGFLGASAGFFGTCTTHS